MKNTPPFSHHDFDHSIRGALPGGQIAASYSLRHAVVLPVTPAATLAAHAAGDPLSSGWGSLSEGQDVPPERAARHEKDAAGPPGAGVGAHKAETNVTEGIVSVASIAGGAGIADKGKDSSNTPPAPEEQFVSELTFHGSFAAAPNAPPVARDDAFVTGEATAITAQNLLADNGNGADSDPDAGDTLSIYAVNGSAINVGVQITLPSGALLTVNSDGTFVYDPNGAFEHIAAGGTGADSFTYTLSDGNFIHTADVFGSALALSSLDGTNGFRIDGVDASDFSGRQVSAAGDVNGDGIDDIIIGAPLADPDGNSSGGESYVVFGSSGGFTPTLSLSDLDGSNGFRIDGIDAGDQAGWSVSSAGDVNGDGVDDLLIGASGGDPLGHSNAGESYVVFGSSTGFSSALSLSDLDGSNGFRVNGINADDGSGAWVSAAGDLNDDGIDDFLIGGHQADPGGASSAGETYVVFGASDGFSSSFALSGLNGSNGFRLTGVDAGDQSGFNVAGVGDVNGDGIDDIIIGAPHADPGGNSAAGESFVVFGSSGGFSATLALSSLNGSNGFRIDGAAVNDQAGHAVSSAGDVNGDGIDDILIGAHLADSGGNTDPGASFVVYGTTDGFAPALSLSDLDGSNGFRIDGMDAGDNSGISVASAGDVNGDGIDDILIGARGADPNGVNSAGESYVVFGTTDGFGSTLSLSALNGSNGFRIDGINSNDFSGSTVSAAGDINGDGIDDLIIGAYFGDPGGAVSAGETYVIFGRPSFAPYADVASVAVTVNGVNDAPEVNGLGETLTMVEQEAARALPHLSLADVDSATLASATVSITGGFVSGQDVLSFTAAPGMGNIAGSYSAATGVLTLTSAGATATRADWETALRAVFYTNSADTPDTSNRTVSVVVNDGSDNSAVTTQVLTVTAVNDLPVAQDDEFTISENGMLAAQSVLADTGNGADTDPDGAALSVVAVNGQEAHVGTQITLASGALLTVNSDGTFTYDSNGAFDGLAGGAADTDSFTYTLTDGSTAQSAGSFASALALSALDGTNGFRIDGIDAGDSSGHSVAGAGDVNGDGIDDLIIGAQGGDPGAVSQAGESYVVFGSSDGFTPALSLSDLDGTNGFRIDGINLSDRSGHRVAGAGDVNGDGIGDVIIGAHAADPGGAGQAGESYVVFGSSGGFTPALSLSDLDGSNGFRLEGTDAHDYSGYSVASAGDFNGDGIDDLIVGARNADPAAGSNAGESYVVFGTTGGFGPALSLSDLDGSNGFRIDGAQAGGASGVSVSHAGDVNNDGLDDLIIGALGVGGAAGASYVVFGNSSGYGADLALSSLDGTNGFRIDGRDGNDFSGVSVSSAGDVNGDGIDDVLIGANGADPDGNSAAGESYVVFGASGGFGPALSLSDLDGSNGFRLDGIDGFDYSGHSVSSAGDVNGDGVDDILIGARLAAPGGNSTAGESYVVFGCTGGFAPALSLSDLNGTNGFRIDGIDAGDVSGRSVSAAGDINGDGLDDILIGADGANGSAGETYVIFGRAVFAPAVDIATVTITLNGVNDLPSFAGLPGTLLADEDTATNLDLSAATLSDPDATSLSISLTADLGTLAAVAAGGVSVTGSDTSLLTLSGSVPALSSYLQTISAVQYTGPLDGFGTGLAAIDITVNDGAGETAMGTVQVDITEAPDTRNGDSGDNTIMGDAGTDILNGRDGDDILEGAGGSDTLNGGDGTDTARYASSEAGVTVRLWNGTGSGGDAEGDVFGGIENVIGSGFGDTLIGSFGTGNLLDGGTGNDLLRGLSGDDTLIGGAGADTLEGGDHSDTVSYQSSGTGVTVNLDTGTALGGDAAGDVWSGIENLFGSLFHDALSGDGFDNLLQGEAGNDTLNGGDGADTLLGGADNDTLRGQAGNDLLDGGFGDDTVNGGGGDDHIIAGPGTDLLIGNIGVDTLDYAADTAGIDVALFSNSVSGGLAANDTISGFENVHGGGRQ